MLAVISLLGVLPMAIAGKIHPYVGMHVMSRPKPVANKAASVILAKPHKISRLGGAAVGIVLSEQATHCFLKFAVTASYKQNQRSIFFSRRFTVFLLLLK
jgi:hypothetical protein